MRRIPGLRPTAGEAGFMKRRAKNTVKSLQRNEAIASTQNERPVPRSAVETHCTVKGNLEPRHRNGRRGSDRLGHDPPRQTRVLAKIMQRDMKALRPKRVGFQSMFAAQTLGKPCDAGRSARVRVNRKKKGRRVRHDIEPTQRELLRHAGSASRQQNCA